MWIDEAANDKPTFPGVAIPRRCILVVQDDTVARDIMISRLKRDGHLVYAAASGTEVLTTLRFIEQFGRPSIRFELAIFDHHLPGMTGMEIIRRLRSEGNAIPALLMASYLDPDLISEADGYQIPVLSKPIDLDLLSDVTIDAILRQQVPRG